MTCLTQAFGCLGPPHKERGKWPKSCLPEKILPEIRCKVLIVSDCSDVSLGFRHINSLGSAMSSPNLILKNVRRGTDILIRIVQRAQFMQPFFIDNFSG